MRTLVTALLALGFAGVLAIGATPPAAAQGFYFNAPGVHVRVGHPYHRYYRGPYYGGGYYGYGRPNCYAGGCCPPGMTIQGGACRPYRGW